MININSQDYIWEWERQAYPYYFYSFNLQWRENKFSLPVYSVMTYESGTVNAYLDKPSLAVADKDILDKVEQSDEYFSAWSSYVQQTGKELHELGNHLETADLSKLKDAELLAFFKQMFSAYKNHNDNVGVIRNSNRELQERLEVTYADSNMIATLLSTTEKSLFNQEHEALLQIAEAKRAGRDIGSQILAHTKKYYYLPCGYYGEAVYREKDFAKNLDEILESGETLAEFNNKWEKSIEERKNLLKKLKPEPATRRLIDFGSHCTFFKDFIRGNLNRLQYFNQLFFTEVAKRKGGAWADVANFVYPEIAELLENKCELEKRERMLLYSDKEGIHWLVNDKATPEIEKIKHYFVSVQATEIIGTPASPGKVRGKVKIIRQLSDLGTADKFILVSPMTTPDLMSALKKAVAIVTDEGGLTCHAAIVSRELNIPCIIGTKVATKVLQDGDLVEVDAEKGVVRKLF